MIEYVKKLREFYSSDCYVEITKNSIKVDGKTVGMIGINQAFRAIGINCELYETEIYLQEMAKAVKEEMEDNRPDCWEKVEMACGGKLTISQDGLKMYINGEIMNEIDVLRCSAKCRNILGTSIDRAVEITIDYIKQGCAERGLIEKNAIDIFISKYDENADYYTEIEEIDKLLTKIYAPFYASQSFDVAVALVGGIAKAICKIEDYDYFNPQQIIAILGNPGIGKTTQITEIFGDTAYNTNRFAFSMENEGREIIKLKGKLAYVCDDMTHSHDDTSALKAFATAKNYTYRPCMANYSTETRNTATVIITSNDREIVADEPGIERRLTVLESTLTEYNKNVTAEDTKKLRQHIINASHAQIRDRIRTPKRLSNVDRYITENVYESVSAMNKKIGVFSYNELNEEKFEIMTIKNALDTQILPIDIIRKLPKTYELAQMRRIKRSISGQAEFGTEEEERRIKAPIIEDDDGGFPFDY